MQVKITRTTPIYRDPYSTGVFLQWNVLDPPDVGPFSFKIERSGSPEGPFELVLDNVTTFHFFDDLRHVPAPPEGSVRENLNFLSLHRAIYYKVTGTIGGETSFDIQVTGDNLPTRQALLRRKIQRDIRVGFKFSGIPLVILKRRHWGERCKDCFDQLTKRVTKSKCTTCFGTGFENGYFDPVRISGRIGVENIQTQITPQGKTDINQRALTTLDFPVFEEDDIIAELRQNRRYVITNISQTELRTVSVHQRSVLSELSRDSIEYRIVINPDHIPVIY